jgi:hypothetical protein
MPRTVGDIPTGSNDPPPVGPIEAKCFKAEKWTSPVKGTKAVMLHWQAGDGAYEFTDAVFVTTKAIGRLSLVAQRVCGMPKDTALPDDDAQAAAMLAKYILDNAAGRSAIVTIEEQVEEFIYSEGVNVGKKGTKTRKKVAFSGYAPIPHDAPGHEGEGFEFPRDDEADASIPF